MTLEDPENRGSTRTTEPQIAQARRRRQLPPEWDNCAADEMLRFVDKARSIADQIRGLAQLFRGTFLETGQGAVGYEEASDIILDVMESFAKRLDSNAEQARARRNHLAAGGT